MELPTLQRKIYRTNNKTVWEDFGEWCEWEDHNLYQFGQYVCDRAKTGCYLDRYNNLIMGRFIETSELNKIIKDYNGS